MPPAPSPPPDRATQLFGLALALGAAGCAAGVARHALAMRFSHDDWEWLARGRDVPALVAEQLSFRSEVFRPVPRDLFALSLALFGLRTLPLAAFFLGVHALCAWQVARLGAALGLSRWAGAFAALLVFFGRESVEAFDFFSLNQVILSRLLVVAALTALLREERPPWWRWLPLTLAALGTHEQSALAAPLFLLCLVYRDGPAALRGLPRAPARRAFLAVCVGYGLLRVALLDPARQGSHALGFGALGFKAGVFVDHVAAFLHAHFGTGEAALPTLVTLAAFLFWCYRRTRRALPTLGLGAAWALVGYGPYFLAIHETSGYHFALALVGLALPAGALLDFWLFDPGLPRAVRLLAMPLALWVALPVWPHPPLITHKDFSAGARVVDLLRAGLRGAPGREPVRLIFLDDEWEPRGPPPFYLVQMSGEFDFNLDEHPTDNRNGALALNFPGRDVRVWVLGPTWAPLACARPGDVVLRVAHRRAGTGEARLGFEPLPKCADPPPGLADPVDAARRADAR